MGYLRLPNLYERIPTFLGCYELAGEQLAQ